MGFNLVKNQISVEFSKFIISGISSTIISYSIFWICLDYLNLNYLISAINGFICGLLIGYNINSRWTFKSSKKRKFSSYLGVYFMSLLFSLIFLKITVGGFAIDAKIANLVAIALTTFTNFFGIRAFVFKDKN